MLEHGNQTPEAPALTAIVGAGGFVGGAIARRLEASGAAIRRIGRAEADLNASGAADRLAEQLAGCDAAILISAVAPVKNLAMLRENMTLIEAMDGALRSARPGYVLNIGSDAVFADSKGPLVEASYRAPGSLHGIMHLTREVVLGEAAGEAGFATLRPTLIYGADDPHNGYGPNRFRRQAALGGPITLFGQGEERRDHIWVEDVAELAARMVMRRSAGSLNAVTGRVASFMDIARMAAEMAPAEVAIEGSPRSGPMPHDGYRPFDAAAVAAAFPDFSFTPLEEGLARAKAQDAG